jgi:H+/Cl- antiporter ClcA
VSAADPAQHGGPQPPRPGAAAGADPAQDPLKLARSRAYVVLLVLAGAIGVPIAALSFGFLQAVEHLQSEVFDHLPRGLGFHAAPSWWPVPVLGVAGVLVALVIRYLPGEGGHEPLGGLVTGKTSAARDLPGIALAALTSLSLGVVLGPEAPLVAMGGATAAAVLRRLKPDAGDGAASMFGAAGSFAAISTLFGSPLAAAFLLMEASGLASPLLGVVMLPGLLAAGIGALMFTGLNGWTGLPDTSLAVPGLPRADSPTVAEFCWAVLIGLAAALLAAVVMRLGRVLRAQVAPRRLWATPVAGLVIAVAVVIYFEATGKPESDVLFSGQSGIGSLLEHRAGYSLGAVVVLLVCKAAAFAFSLSAFRGGMVFPSLFLGVAGGLALSHLPGLELVPAIAMGIGSMAAGMLGLPLSAVLLATLLLGGNGLTVMPLVIVAVVVARTATLHLSALRGE